MKFTTLPRYAVMLAFMILGQQFCDAFTSQPDLNINTRTGVKSGGAHITASAVSCRIFKYAFYAYLYKQCMAGTPNLQGLYNQRIKQLLSEGGQLTPKCQMGDFDTVKLKLIEFGKKESGFYIDCILNDPEVQAKACSLGQKGYSKLFIANRMKLTIEQVDILLKDCPEPGLTVVQKEAICLMKKYGLTAKRISNLLGPVSKESTIKAHMAMCS